MQSLHASVVASFLPQQEREIQHTGQTLQQWTAMHGFQAKVLHHVQLQTVISALGANFSCRL